MDTITISRTGDSPLRFEGELLATAGGRLFTARKQNRWHELALFRAADRRYVLCATFRTCWKGEAERRRAHVCQSADDVRQWLRDYDPVPNYVGFPAAEHYADRQRALEAALRSQYDHCVSELLAGDEFATSLEAAAIDDYWSLDREAIAEFVRAQLAEFPLTRNEACAICDANNGALLMGHCWFGLSVNVFDAARLNDADELWSVDCSELSQRINAADRGTQFALAWAVAQFWRHCERDTDLLLPESGFTIIAPALGDED